MLTFDSNCTKTMVRKKRERGKTEGEGDGRVGDTRLEGRGIASLKLGIDTPGYYN